MKKTDLVVLERRDHKTAELPLSEFSSKDQEYILSLQQTIDPQKEDDAVATEKALSKKALKEIGEKFENAIEEQDKTALDSLYLNPGRYRYSLDEIQQVEIDDIEENTIFVTMVGKKEGFGCRGWMHITSSGKIKYSPFTQKHPIERAASAIFWLSYVDKERKKSDVSKMNGAINDLEASGIPTFELKQDMSFRDLGDNLDKVREWIIENGATYDTGEPKLYIPRKQMKKIISEIKK